MATAAWIIVALIAGWVSGMVSARKIDGWLTGWEARKALKASRALLKKLDREGTDASAR